MDLSWDSFQAPLFIIFLYKILSLIFGEMMRHVYVGIGTQFGDESKGGVIYFFAEDADLYVRFNGGNNAGHEVEEKKLHYLPAGICRAPFP